MKNPLSFEAVRKVCDPELVKRLAPLNGANEIIIGQDRAVKAIQFGLGIRADGYNIFVSGAPGTGKLTAIKRFIQEPASKEPVPSDWCYVNNFKDPYKPTRLSLPAGMAVEFKQDMKTLISDAHQTLMKAFENEDYLRRKRDIAEHFSAQQAGLFNELNERARKESIMVEETPMDIYTVPLKNGKPMTEKQFNDLGEDEQKEIRAKQEKFMEEIKVVVREARKLKKSANEEVIKLEKEVATYAISALMEEMEEKYTTIPDVLQHLKEVRKDILINFSLLLMPEKPGDGVPGDGTESSFRRRYDVNTLVENTGVQGAPVILELNPTYNNLFGRVEKESSMGTWVTDLSLIRQGSLHAANGGYLILRVEDLFKNYFSWESLKRAIKNKEIVIEEAGDQWGFITTKTLRPEPIPLKLKVILIGSPLFYSLLYEYDTDFKELFKVKADFDVSMERNDKAIGEYMHFCSFLRNKEGLLQLNDEAVAKIIEHGSRLADDQGKLTTYFSEIANVMREANFFASSDHAKEITAAHVQKAIEEKVYRSSLIRDKLNEMIGNGQIMIDVKGTRVGQVNALSVIRLGDIDFGIPSRITCTTGLGKDGIIAIEREAELSGPIHTKGVMILSGYLSEKFIQDRPISLNARLAFEQSYSEVEGDSASSTELYALLSSLSGVPIKQNIAVTGSINQKGEIQAIGGVNEKIEGFFEVCKRLGALRDQGVIIPSANMRNLMLKEEIQEAVRDGRFNIWAIDSVDEGIEILTGCPAGNVDEEGTIDFMVNHRLGEYAQKLKAFAESSAQGAPH